MSGVSKSMTSILTYIFIFKKLSAHLLFMYGLNDRNITLFTSGESEISHLKHYYHDATKNSVVRLINFTQ